MGGCTLNFFSPMFAIVRLDYRELYHHEWERGNEANLHFQIINGSLVIISFFTMRFGVVEGHTTMTCPHRVATEYGVVPAPRRNKHNSLDYVFERQLRPRIPKVIFLSTFRD